MTLNLLQKTLLRAIIKIYTTHLIINSIIYSVNQTKIPEFMLTKLGSCRSLLFMRKFSYQLSLVTDKYNKTLEIGRAHV